MKGLEGDKESGETGTRENAGEETESPNFSSVIYRSLVLGGSRGSKHFPVVKTI